jgi:hypothetical protein
MTRDNGMEIRVLAATGVCGSGFREASLAEGMRRQPHFIGCDCGSTDPGPYPLRVGVTAFPRVAIKRDLRLMLLAARQAGIPLLLGSAGTAGGAPHLAIVKDLLCEIAAEEGLRFPLAIIHAEQGKTYLKQRLREGRIISMSSLWTRRCAARRKVSRHTASTKMPIPTDMWNRAARSICPRRSTKRWTTAGCA